MPQPPKLRTKTIKRIDYWVTKAAGDAYFGRGDEVSAKQTRRRFAVHLLKLQNEQRANKGPGLTARELMDVFLRERGRAGARRTRVASSTSHPGWRQENSPCLS
jgi:hypothetical protein